MAFDNLTDAQVRDIVASNGTFLDNLELKGLLEALDVVAGSAGGSVSFTDLTNVPATFPPTIGTTATTAKAGNYTPPNATTSVKGVVNQAAAQANSTATDVAGLVADLNALLAKLRTAGVLAP